MMDTRIDTPASNRMRFCSGTKWPLGRIAHRCLLTGMFPEGLPQRSELALPAVKHFSYDPEKAERRRAPSGPEYHIHTAADSDGPE